jgi:hypothetical protein
MFAVFLDSVFDFVLNAFREVSVSRIVWSGWHDPCDQQVAVSIEDFVGTVSRHPDWGINGERVTRDVHYRLLRCLLDLSELRRLLLTSVKQAGWSGEVAIDTSDFQRDQNPFHYRDRANYSLQSMKTTILINANSLAIRDVHYTTKKA